MSLNQYLAGAKKKSASPDLVVMGNAAADLDSMVSAITYGYLRSFNETLTVVVPVMPIPRSDFDLRREAVYLFKLAGLDLADLVFLDEIDLDGVLSAGAGLILVDHNRLIPSMTDYGASVVGVLDHHRDEGLYPKGSPRIIQAVGSTATLVAGEFFRQGAALLPEVAILLCGTILLDTVNLDPAAGRVTEADRKAVDRLQSLCGLSSKVCFTTLQDEKFNVKDLSTADLLRKDYKEFLVADRRYGIASVLVSAVSWLELDENLATGFYEYALHHHLDVLLSMNLSTNVDSTHRRDLVLFCKNQSIHDSVLSCLQDAGLHLNPLLLPSRPVAAGCLKFYRQGDIHFSRKKIVPILAGLVAR
jgi:exopolyphosphatase